jgi:ubiquitin-conjugating enzyme E2 D/E/ubiquitin-conjugating enzyme E2 H
MDVYKLMMSSYKVELSEESSSEFFVDFKVLWSIYTRVVSGRFVSRPSIGFITKIFHPNIDEASGSVCSDTYEFIDFTLDEYLSRLSY